MGIIALNVILQIQSIAIGTKIGLVVAVDMNGNRYYYDTERKHTMFKKILNLIPWVNLEEKLFNIIISRETYNSLLKHQSKDRQIELLESDLKSCKKVCNLTLITLPTITFIALLLIKSLIYSTQQNKFAMHIDTSSIACTIGTVIGVLIIKIKSSAIFKTKILNIKSSL